MIDAFLQMASFLLSVRDRLSSARAAKREQLLVTLERIADLVSQIADALEARIAPHELMGELDVYIKRVPAILADSGLPDLAGEAGQLLDSLGRSDEQMIDDLIEHPRRDATERRGDYGLPAEPFAAKSRYDMTREELLAMVRRGAGRLRGLAQALRMEG